LKVRPFESDLDLEWAEAFLDAEMGGRMQARLGELVDVLGYPGFIAEADGERVGLLTYRCDGNRCEVAVIAARRQSGAGTALIDALRAAVDEPIWLITTNDNIDALRFYQRRGFRITAVHRDAVDAARKLKPQIGPVGEYGIRRRDELELWSDQGTDSVP
jgi:ribosomal protein S18 acetylase RimI-like enzyme